MVYNYIKMLTHVRNCTVALRMDAINGRKEEGRKEGRKIDR